MTRRSTYRIAGTSLTLDAHGAWAASVIDARLAGWYLSPAATEEHAAPAIVVRSGDRRGEIPRGLGTFDLTDDAICHTDGRSTYVVVGGSVVSFGALAQPVEIALAAPMPRDPEALTFLLTCGLSAALRRRARFELPGAGLADPQTGEGVIIAGPTGIGKSTLALHLASAGWTFLTDDDVLIGRAHGAVSAWPQQRRVAVTSETLAAGGYQQGRGAFDRSASSLDKWEFSPDALFAGPTADRCTPATLLFPTLTGAAQTTVAPLTPGETMTRLVRVSAWASYDRVTAAAHLATLSALSAQVSAWTIESGRDLLSPAVALAVVADCTRSAARRLA